MYELSERVNGLAATIAEAAKAVHAAIGPGYVESIYEESLCLELQSKGVPFRRQVEVPIQYLQRQVGLHRLDLVVDDAIVLELKAVTALSQIHYVQLLSYLRASRLQLGLLINFNVPDLRMGIRRVIHTR